MFTRSHPGLYRPHPLVFLRRVETLPQLKGLGISEVWGSYSEWETEWPTEMFVLFHIQVSVSVSKTMEEAEGTAS